MQTVCLSARPLGDATVSSGPAAVDICVFPGDGFAATVQFRDEDGNPSNMGGSTWTAEIRDIDDALVTAFAVDSTDAANGNLAISLTPSQTASLDGLGLLQWSLVGTLFGTDPRTFLTGNVSTTHLGRPGGGVDSVHVTMDSTGDTVRVALAGAPGAQGPPGPVGPPGGAMTVFVHSQVVADTTWTIVHNLGYFPNVNLEDNTSTQIEGELNQLSVTTLQILFDVPVAGTAYLS